METEHLVEKNDRWKKFNNVSKCVTTLTGSQTYEYVTKVNKTLVNDQLDEQLLYFIIGLLQSSTCFEQRRAHHQELKLY